MTDTETTTLTAWLGVQLDADEAAELRRMLGVPERWHDETIPEGHVGVIVDGRREVIPFTGSYPEPDRRALATVAAHRAIVEREERRLREAWRSRIDEHHLSWEEWLADWPTPTLDDLASIYADRDGYREEWAL